MDREDRDQPLDVSGNCLMDVGSPCRFQGLHQCTSALTAMNSRFLEDHDIIVFPGRIIMYWWSLVGGHRDGDLLRHLQDEPDQ